MKFVFDRDAMIKEVVIAQEIINNKSLSTVLSTIFLIAKDNKLTIKSTDASVTFTSTIPVEVEEEGQTTVYCDKFMSILSAIPPGDVSFKKDDITVFIKPMSKKINFKLNSHVSENFPEFESDTNVTYFEFPSKDLKDMIKHTIFSVNDDNAYRVVMSGVYFEKKEDKFISVATDGKRLSCVKKINSSIQDFKSSIVPTKVLNCILKNASEEGNVMIAVNDNTIYFKFGNIRLTSNLVDGEYVDYERVIPRNLNNSFQVNKADLEAALKRTIIMIEKKVSRIIFKVTPGVLKLISPESAIGTADEEIPCRYDGQEILIAFNFNYLTDPIRVINTENIVFEFKIPDNQIGGEANITGAVILHGDEECDYLHVIMPMNY